MRYFENFLWRHCRHALRHDRNFNWFFLWLFTKGVTSLFWYRISTEFPPLVFIPIFTISLLIKTNPSLQLHHQRIMSLREMHLHLMLYARTQTARKGNQHMTRWCQGNEIHALAVDFLRSHIRGSTFELNRIALAACQDLVRLKLISLEQASGHRSFSKRPGCMVYLHTSASSSKSYRASSGLYWT